MVYSMKDFYGNSSSSTMTTSDQSIPEGDEERYYLDSQTSESPSTGTDQNLKQVTTTANKALVWGSLLLLVVVMFLLHLIQ